MLYTEKENSTTIRITKQANAHAVITDIKDDELARDNSIPGISNVIGTATAITIKQLEIIIITIISM